MIFGIIASSEDITNAGIFITWILLAVSIPCNLYYGKSFKGEKITNTEICDRCGNRFNSGMFFISNIYFVEFVAPFHTTTNLRLMFELCPRYAEILKTEVSKRRIDVITNEKTLIWDKYHPESVIYEK